MKIEIDQHVNSILTTIGICVVMALFAAMVMHGCEQCEMTNRAKIQAQHQDMERGRFNMSVTTSTNIEPYRY